MHIYPFLYPSVPSSVHASFHPLYHLPSWLNEIEVFVQSLKPFRLKALTRTFMRGSLLSMSKPWKEHVLFGRNRLQLRQSPPCSIWTWNSVTEPPPDSDDDASQETSFIPHCFRSIFVIDGMKGTPVNAIKKILSVDLHFPILNGEIKSLINTLN